MKVLIAVICCLAGLALLAVLGFVVLGYTMVRSINAVMRSGPTYRLTNCTAKGQTLLESAFSGRVHSWSTESSDGSPVKFGVGAPDWAEAKQILHKLEQAHPKDFSNEAAAPTERSE